MIHCSGCAVKCTFAPMNRETQNCEWFESWFDSRYYPILYSNRSEEEAKNAVIAMSRELKLPDSSKVLDLACGRGRHAVVLASQGYDVTGVDLSAHSIADASANAGERLRFFVHDMRRPVAINYFDAVFNFFTSFGYFESSRDNIRTLTAVAACLRKNGSFVLDYFNSESVRKAVASDPEGSKHIDGIHFHWKKKIEGEFCIKLIEVNDQGRIFHFQERVQLFTETQMREMLEKLFLVNKVFGDYSLTQFNPEKSDRMIFYCSKRA